MRPVSFDVNHLLLEAGVYLHSVHNLTQYTKLYTYDLRFVAPRSGFGVLGRIPKKAAHSIEHILATTFRFNRDINYTPYVGGMLCMTGFYVITKTPPERFLIELKAALLNSLQYSVVPAANELECGSPYMHSIKGALKWLQRYYDIIKDKEVLDEYPILDYPQSGKHY